MFSRALVASARTRAVGCMYGAPMVQKTFHQTQVLNRNLNMNINRFQQLRFKSCSKTVTVIRRKKKNFLKKCGDAYELGVTGTFIVMLCGNMYTRTVQSYHNAFTIKADNFQEFFFVVSGLAGSCCFIFIKSLAYSVIWPVPVSYWVMNLERGHDILISGYHASCHPRKNLLEKFKYINPYYWSEYLNIWNKDQDQSHVQDQDQSHVQDQEQDTDKI